MKKLVLTIAIILGLGMTLCAQKQPAGGGIFGKGETRGGNNTNEEVAPMIPHLGSNNDQTAPLGGGLLLIGFGAAYALLRKDKKD